MTAEEIINSLKTIKGLDAWGHKQVLTAYMYYKRKGKYAECKCSECGEKYILLTEPTYDPFQDAALDIEKPERDEKTKCRKCGVKATYKPIGRCKDGYKWTRFVYGQKIDDETFIFRFYYTDVHLRAGYQAKYDTVEEKRIILRKGKAPERWSRSWPYYETWYRGGCGENYYYDIHPRTYKEITKTGMFKYVPLERGIIAYMYDRNGFVDYYIAAARYPDFEMILKMGMTEYARNLVAKIPVNMNPRGKTIADRLRINKNRIPELVADEGKKDTLDLFQFERRCHAHWTDEEVEIVKQLRSCSYRKEYEIPLKYVSPTRLKNYMTKQKMWKKPEESYKTTRKKDERRTEYYDYLRLRKESGYDLSDEIILFPNDVHRRHNEMVLECERARQEKRIQEVLNKFPKIKANYKKLADKYSAAAGGFIIRPAKDAAEIVTEGRLLHHCVGGDNYLSSHNTGRSVILFLRPVKEKDVPFITVEIREDKIVQWYGAYDKKPNEKLFDKWLETYCQELEKRKKEAQNVKKTKKTVRKTTKSVQKTA